MLEINEMFGSVDGEGPNVGKATFFIRLAGCPLRCSWCDTKYALKSSDGKMKLTPDEVVRDVKNSMFGKVTLTGGEPLMQGETYELIWKLIKAGIRVDVETSGAIPLPKTKFAKRSKSITWIVDYKLPGSKMENRMNDDLFRNIHKYKNAVVKFVVKDETDLKRAEFIIMKYGITNDVYLSPVFGDLKLQTLADEVVSSKMLFPNLRVQCQLHKFIWDPEKRGV